MAGTSTVTGGVPIATSQPAVAADAVLIADDFSNEQIDERLARTKRLLVDIEAQWPGLVSLPAGDRSGNLGKLVANLAEPLRLLIAALTPEPGEDPVKVQAKQRLKAIFDVSLGASDRGHDPNTFEVDLLSRRLARFEAEQAIVDQLDEVIEHFSDDMLNTGEMIIEPALAALQVAKGLQSTNSELGSLLAPVANSLKDLTKAARAQQNQARKLAAQLDKAKANVSKTTVKAQTEMTKAQHQKDALAAELAAVTGQNLPDGTSGPTTPTS